MPSISISGQAGLTKRFTADTDGQIISFVVPVKTFIIKPVGGTVYFKFKASDDDADAFPLTDGESVAVDLSFPYPIASNTSTVGVVTTLEGTVEVYVMVGY